MYHYAQLLFGPLDGTQSMSKQQANTLQTELSPQIWALKLLKFPIASILFKLEISEKIILTWIFIEMKLAEI